MGDEPILLFLLRGVLHLIGWVCSVFAAPTSTFFLLSQPVVLNAAFKRDGGGLTHTVLAPLRLVCFPLGIALLSTAWFPLGVWFFITSDVLILVAASFAGVFMQVYGLVYLHRYVECCKKIEYGPYLLSSMECILDVFALLGFLIGFASVLQTPSCIAIVHSSWNKPRAATAFSANYRLDAMLQPLYVVLDLLLLGPWILFVLCTWRWAACSAILKRNSKGDPWYIWVHSLPLRALVAGQGVLGVLDVLQVVLTVLACIPVPWRLLYLAKGCFDPNILPTPSAREARLDQIHRTCGTQMVEAVLDLISLLISLLWLGTLYRAPTTIARLVRMIKTDQEGHEVRAVMYQQAGLVIGDVFFLFCCVFTCAFLYRIPVLLKALWQGRGEASWEHYEWQGKAVKMAGEQLIDIPFLVMAAAVLPFAWRSIIMLRSLFKAGSASERREIAIHHFGWVIIDLLIDLFFLLMALAMCLTLLRLPRLKRDVGEEYEWGKSLDNMRLRNAIRGLIIMHFLLWLLDLPVLGLSLVICATLWRARRLFLMLANDDSNINLEDDFESSLPSELKPKTTKGAAVELFKSHRIVLREFGFWCLDIVILPMALLVFVSYRSCSLFSQLDDLQRDPNRAFGSHVHMVVLKSGLALAIDIPFLLLGLASLWRIPLLITHQVKHCSTDWQRRKAAAKYFGLTLLDIPCSLLAVLVLALAPLTWWRVVELVKVVKLESGKSGHLYVAKTATRAVIDAPFVVLGIAASVLAPWRAWDLLQRVLKEGDDAECRADAVLHLLMAIADWLTMASCLVLTVTLLRLPTLLWATQRSWGKKPGPERCGSIYSAVAQNMVFLVMDVLSLLQAALVLALLARAPAMLYRLGNLFSRVKRVRSTSSSNAARGRVGSEDDDDDGAGHAAPSHIVHMAMEAQARRDSRSSSGADNTRPMLHAGPAEPAAAVTARHVLWPSAWMLWDDVKEGKRVLGYRGDYEDSCDPDVSAPISWTAASQVVASEWGYTVLAYLQLIRLVPKALCTLLLLTTRAFVARFTHASLYVTWFMGHPAYWAKGVVGEKTFFNIDDTLWLQLSLLTFWLIHDLAFLPASLNTALMSLFTFGSNFGWAKRLVQGSATNYAKFERAMTVLFVVQAFLMPLFLALQPVLLLAPVLVYQASHIIDSVEAGNPFSIPGYLSGVPVGMWIVQGVWAIIFLLSFNFIHVARRKYFTFEMPIAAGVHLRKHKKFSTFAPIWCYVWVVTHVFKGRVWQGYKGLLAVPTRVMYSWSNGCVKNLALIIVFFTWCGWPLVLAGFVDLVAVWIICAVFTAFLLWRGYNVVEVNWKNPVPQTPQITFECGCVELPTPFRKPNGELSHRRAVLTVLASKPDSFGPGGYYSKDGERKSWPQDRMFQVEIEVEGEEFWGDVRKAVGRMAVSLARNLGFHPFKVCPKYLDPLSLEEHPRHWKAVIDVDMRETSRHPNFMKILDKLERAGGHRMVVHFWFGFTKNGTYKRVGKLFDWNTNVTEMRSDAAVRAVRVMDQSRGAGSSGAGGMAVGAGIAAGGSDPSMVTVDLGTSTDSVHLTSSKLYSDSSLDTEYA